MKEQEYHFSYQVYDSLEELPASDAALLARAREAAGKAYAPYSRFLVGAAARLANGEIITGSNQENASYPVGICAERTLLAAAGNAYPGVAIQSMAISYQSDLRKSDLPITPCGMCRQALQEFEERTQKPIRLILGGMEGPVYIIPESMALLPLAFNQQALTRG